jgi:hypothetical protein
MTQRVCEGLLRHSLGREERRPVDLLSGHSVTDNAIVTCLLPLVFRLKAVETFLEYAE